MAQSATFSAGAANWTSVTLAYNTPGNPPVEIGNPASVVFSSTGGNAGGFLRVIDPDGQGAGNVQYWKAPANFLGDKATYCGGALRFDISVFTPYAIFPGQEDVLLTGNGITIAHFGLASPQVGVWTRHSVPLTAGSWTIGDRFGRPASATEIQGVLGSLSSMYIRGEFQYNLDDIGVDNIEFYGPGSFLPYGAGCAGSNLLVPALTSAGLPVIGSQFQLRASNASPLTVAMFATGLSNVSFQTFSLPFHLASLGAPGCFVHSSLEFTELVVTDSSGNASQVVAIPGLPGFVGTRLFHQVLVFDSGANSLGLCTSNAGASVLGF